eukprot:TRINITY_DN351_c0_g1_i3.p1 TRINITY_DN351_c0_g1~~TRINITY_DN351_c0_g1_i3.p1  ORF type:complete len:152 (-),score=30.84 TRINITY_DN351_c0_g1_i3:548-967(-)
MALGHLFVTIFLVSLTCAEYLPVVLWHGMGDTCCYPFSMGRIKRLIEEQLPGIYVYSVMVGDSVEEDERAGFIGNVNDQLKEVYDKINSDSKLLGGFNAIGFSQVLFLSPLIQEFSRIQRVANSFGVMSNIITIPLSKT